MTLRKRQEDRTIERSHHNPDLTAFNRFSGNHVGAAPRPASLKRSQCFSRTGAVSLGPGSYALTSSRNLFAKTFSMPPGTASATFACRTIRASITWWSARDRRRYIQRETSTQSHNGLSLVTLATGAGKCFPRSPFAKREIAARLISVR
jgi:hypothetical protein